MEILIYENGPFMVNSYLVINKETSACFILDPGFEVNPLLEKIRSDKLNLEAIIATHGHIDHVEGVNAIKKKYPVPFMVNELDKPLLETIPVQARMFGVPDPGVPVPDANLPTEGNITVAGLTLELLYTPGHSRGSVSIQIDSVVFSGDALFNFSIGRTDLPGGDYVELISSIKEKLFTLPDDIRVLPGHGPETTIGREKTMNPFFN
ncbi:MAG: MBL fold metallo-hydrolase [Spirochaetae bacterium HGW-Spirochaetae-1]|jgi:glyoxylase-like metal-dependent hydrolase (beta-lactamase superfamily II)|nr:MAG: MBL fold metallo-hydrolase [Spirochaetae bacterium HGW-Spirochaetae-1]